MSLYNRKTVNKHPSSYNNKEEVSDVQSESDSLSDREKEEKSDSDSDDSDYSEDETSPSSSNKQCCNKYGIMITVIIIVMIVIIGYYGANENMDSSDSAIEDIDYYKVLELDSNAAIEKIKIQYKKLILKWHPDKCKENICESMFLSIKKAYEVLNDPIKKKIYDTTSKTYNLIVSETIELNNKNFNDYVINSNSLWFIQIYADWSQASQGFSKKWENEYFKYSGQDFVKFGRIHATSEQDLLKRLPITFKSNFLPSVYSYFSGRLKPWNQWSGTFAEWLINEIPSVVNIGYFNEFFDLKAIKSPNTEFYLFSSNKNISPLLKAVAMQYENVAKFSQIVVNNDSIFKKTIGSPNFFPALLFVNAGKQEWIKVKSDTLAESVSNSLLGIKLKFNAIEYLSAMPSTCLNSDRASGCLILIESGKYNSNPALRKSYETAFKSRTGSKSRVQFVEFNFNWATIHDEISKVKKLDIAELVYYESYHQTLYVCMNSDALLDNDWLNNLIDKDLWQSVPSNLGNLHYKNTVDAGFFDKYYEELMTILVILVVVITFYFLYITKLWLHVVLAVSLGSFVLSLLIQTNPIVEMLKKIIRR